jgi:hypothetical protein
MGFVCRLYRQLLGIVTVFDRFTAEPVGTFERDLQGRT